jgi:hypothetical protein
VQVRAAKDFLAPGEAAALLAHALPLLHLADTALANEGGGGSNNVDPGATDAATAATARELVAVLVAWLQQRTEGFEEHLTQLEAAIEKCAPCLAPWA